jgi:hypothetical protein
MRRSANDQAFPMKLMRLAMKSQDLSVRFCHTILTPMHKGIGAFGASRWKRKADWIACARSLDPFTSITRFYLLSSDRNPQDRGASTVFVGRHE